MIETQRPVQVVIASGPSEPKRLILGLSMAASAASSGSPVRVFLAMDAAECLSEDVCRRELVKGYPPAADLLSAIQESGGVVEYCPHCLPPGCKPAFGRESDAGAGCGCRGVPAGIASYGIRLADHATVVF